MQAVLPNASPTPLADAADKTLSDKTTTALREAIISGQIAAGEKLNEPKLANQFNVSRGPLREAIRRLVAMRLVRYVPNQGATVVTLELDSIMDLYEVREALEGKAAALAAQNMNQQDIAQLHATLAAHQQHLSDKSGEYRQAEGDFDFHYLIIQGSGNELLINQLCNELYHLIRMFRSHTSRMQNTADRALVEHEHLTYAIEQKDSHLAEILMRSHIRRAKRSISDYLTKQTGSEV